MQASGNRRSIRCRLHKRKPLACLARLLALLAALQGAGGAVTRAVDSGHDLAANLVAADAPDVLLLTRDVRMQQADWPTGVSTQLKKNVTVQGAVANGTSITYPTLDWNWVSRVLTMAPNVWLTLRGVTMAGFRPVLGSDFAFLSYSPRSRLELQDVIVLSPIGVPNTLRVPAALATAPPASMPNFTQQVEAWPGCYGWSNSAGTYFCYEDSMHYIDVASDNPANSAFLWGSGGYVVHYTNCTAAAPRVISEACINASTLVQCYSEGVAASIPPPPAPPTPPAPAAPSDDGPPPVPLQIILPSVLLGTLTLLLLCLGGWWWYRHRTHLLPAPLLSLRRYMAPLPGDETTLVVTDIQGSTALWEALPAAVMDSALKLHHACIRQVLVKYCGTESATEGDSFILAFHTAELALDFCLDAQEQLMQVDWPQKLLNHESTRPLWARPKATVRTSQPAFSTAQMAEVTSPEADVSNALAEFRLPGAQRRRGRRSSVLDLVASRHNSSRRMSFDHFSHISTSHSRSSREGLALHVTGGAMQGTPWLKHLCSQWAVSDTPEFVALDEEVDLREYGESVLVFRGLRVRMGAHSGVAARDVAHNSVSNRTQYTGAALAKTKAVCDLAQGGMVLLSASTFRHITLAPVLQDTVVMHLGDFRSNAKDAPSTAQPLYAAVRNALISRLVALPPPTSELQVSYGTLDAPVGTVSIAFMYLFGYQTIHAWNEQLAVAAADLFSDLVAEKLRQHGGYLVEMDRGFCLAAFSTPYDAIQCANACKEAMVYLPWPASLMEHALCEELLDDVNDALIMRGPRIKVGIDMASEVLTEISPATGRMTFRGKVMNRAARIASKATSGKVFISADCWKACGAEVRAQIDARPQGVLDLKGVGKLEVFCVTYLRHDMFPDIVSPVNPALSTQSGTVRLSTETVRRAHTRRGSLPTMGRSMSMYVAMNTVATQTEGLEVHGLAWKDQDGLVGKDGFVGNGGFVAKDGVAGNGGFVAKNGVAWKDGIVGRDGVAGRDGIVGGEGTEAREAEARLQQAAVASQGGRMGAGAGAGAIKRHPQPAALTSSTQQAADTGQRPGAVAEAPNQQRHQPDAFVLNVQQAADAGQRLGAVAETPNQQQHQPDAVVLNMQHAGEAVVGKRLGEAMDGAAGALPSQRQRHSQEIQHIHLRVE